MDAREELQRAYEGRAEGVEADGLPLVGLFGDGCPEALVSGAGGQPVEVKAAPLIDGPEVASVSAVTEPFMDGFTRRFLHRFASGAFDEYAAVLFARDDVAALAAYQYALEMQRQGMVRTGPRLILWNLLHGTGTALHAFNLSEAERALRELREAVGTVADEGRLARAMAEEQARAQACAALEAMSLTAGETFVFRNAGRWLPAARHAELLTRITPAEPRTTKASAALIGTAADTSALPALCAELGLAVTDLTPYGSLWPACHTGPSDMPGLLNAVAEQPLHIRTNPPARFGAALDAALAGHDLVIAAVDRNDDSFGWELPRLARSLSLPLVNLGFRPFRPGAEWLATARQRIEEALP